MRSAGKIPKACEPCRRRKIKCSGDKPCQQCGNKPSDCVYRLKPRVRLSAKRARDSSSETVTGAGGTVTTPASAAPGRALPGDETSRRSAEERQQQVAQTEVYHSVAAAHHAPKSTDSSQLFYGPSSNSAFLQQIHRGLLSSSGQYGQGAHGRDGEVVQEGGPGLDMFMQRNIFFGMPLRVVDAEPPARCPVSPAQAEEFVRRFEDAHLSTLPFFAAGEMDEMLPSLFSSSPDVQPQRKTVLLAGLALGALSTPQTDAAESLFLHAKKEAAAYEDAVTLPMIQYSMLMAHYQLNMGRPNSSYLHMGVACRKALAMGLQAGKCSGLSSDNEIQARLITMWSLYFLEMWMSLVVGRRSMVGKADFACCPFPDGQPTMVALCQFATIIEDAVDSIYNRRTDSLRQLYAKAEALHAQCRRYGEKWGLGSVVPVQQKAWNAETTLLMHSVYFHVTRRYHAFFIESCCSVLLYDSLRHPAKHPHNLEYIRMAIGCLRSLVADDPVTNAIRSVKSIVWAVENSIGASKTTSDALLSVDGTSATDSLSPSWPDDHRFPTNIQFPSLDENRATTTTTSDDLIFFSNRPYRHQQPEPVPADYSMSLPGATPVLNPFSDLDFDVLTTDLFNFFPIDVNSTPPGAGS
ncbi:C6 zinc finger domain-containing protein [Colletotrichum musicola]|uniref:C6 zinc finger domain-containing protein n=1 Tax=Colletotrichum musicola TaxID=2175873 RepID=A0A8H6JMV5_9PEZI|nr:C6 zinc finger domain-containing protein [Colletotrichum musicola]